MDAWTALVAPTPANAPMNTLTGMDIASATG
jgi:hypothetical protein